MAEYSCGQLDSQIKNKDHQRGHPRSPKRQERQSQGTTSAKRIGDKRERSASPPRGNQKQQRHSPSHSRRHISNSCENYGLRRGEERSSLIDQNVDHDHRDERPESAFGMRCRDIDRFRVQTIGDGRLMVGHRGYGRNLPEQREGGRRHDSTQGNDRRFGNQRRESNESEQRKYSRVYSDTHGGNRRKEGDRNYSGDRTGLRDQGHQYHGRKGGGTQFGDERSGGNPSVSKDEDQRHSQLAKQRQAEYHVQYQRQDMSISGFQDRGNLRGNNYAGNGRHDSTNLRDEGHSRENRIRREGGISNISGGRVTDNFSPIRQGQGDRFLVATETRGSGGRRDNFYDVARPAESLNDTAYRSQLTKPASTSFRRNASPSASISRYGRDDAASSGRQDVAWPVTADEVNEVPAPRISWERLFDEAQNSGKASNVAEGRQNRRALVDRNNRSADVQQADNDPGTNLLTPRRVDHHRSNHD
jgi:hypothetical protein